LWLPTDLHGLGTGVIELLTGTVDCSFSGVSNVNRILLMYAHLYVHLSRDTKLHIKKPILLISKYMHTKTICFLRQRLLQRRGAVL
jgi:hypothetical protein